MAHAHKHDLNPTTSYLDSVRFDPELEKKPWAKYITNFRLVILLILLMLVVGISAFFNLPTRLNPEVKIPIVTIITTLPGASPDDVETLITEPLEKELAGVKGLDTMTSSSRESVSAITLQFTSSTDRDQAREDSQSRVDTVRDLPEDASDPQVQSLDFEDVPVWQFAVSTDGSLPSLIAFADDLKNKLENVNRVDRVVVSGLEEREIQVVISPEKLQELGVNVNALSQSVSTALSSFPAGTVTTSASSFTLAIDPEVATVSDLRNVRVAVGDSVQRLGDIATVSERSVDDQAKSYLAFHDSPARRAVTFSVYKTSTSNIDDASTAVEEVVNEETERYGDQFRVTTVSNTAEEIEEQFSELLVNFRDTILLVFLVLVAFLGLRQALIASFTIPLTFLCSFVFMQAFGLSVNFLTLFSLLLALGLLIDDTVVTVQAMTEYNNTGRFTPQQTGMLVWRDYIVPIWSTTITTTFAFLPLLLAGGIIGEFIKSIPIVVSSTLFSSTAIAVLVTLPLMIFAIRPNIPGRVKWMFRILGAIAVLATVVALSPKNALLPLIIITTVLILIVFASMLRAVTDRIGTFFDRRFPKVRMFGSTLSRGVSHGFIDMHPANEWFRRNVGAVIASKRARRATVAVVVMFALFSYALVPLGFVKNEFFPVGDEDTLYANAELPSGSSVNRSDEVARELLERFRKIPEVERVSADVGQGVSGGGPGGGSGGGNIVGFTLNLKEDRERPSTQLAVDMRREFALYEKAEVSIVELSGGPPAGSDLQITLLGDDLNTLDGYAKQIQDYLDDQPGTTNIESSLKAGTSKLVFVPDYAELSDRGISQGQIGQTLRMFASGMEIDSINVGEEERDIVYRMSTEGADPTSLGRLTIRSGNENIPLSALGRFELRTNPTLITRDDQKRSITVTAGVEAPYSNVEINQGLERFADSLNLPAGYSWKTGGENEENARSVQSIIQAMGLAFILIFGSMVVQFGSFRQAALVLLIIPFAISGVFIIFALTATPLSFPALIGVLALFGIVVTHSIMLVDKINQNLVHGMSFEESIKDSVATRLEPVLLTSLLTVIGLIPITLSDPFWRGLGGAIIAGLMFTGLIKMFLVPTIYYMWFKGDYDANLKTKAPSDAGIRS
jgi:HAE1 family hydrophobic/amphiphilic exporter-1